MSNTKFERREIERALDEIGEAVGVRLVFDEHGVATIELANDIVCSIEAPKHRDYVYFHAPVSGVPKNDRESALALGLRKNLFGLSLTGASVALDEASDEFILCYTAPTASIDGDRLAGIVAAFVDEVGTLREFLKETENSRERHLPSDLSIVIRG